MKRIGALSILGVTMLIFALACGGADEEVAPAVPAAPAPAAPAAPAPAPPVAAPEPAAMGVPPKTQSGSIIVAIDTVHDSADTRIGSRPVWQQYKTLSHDMLLDVEPVTGALVPGVAETWESSTDGSAWTFNLRKGMNFQDGHEVTAEDVKFGFEWQLSEAGNCCASRYLDIVREIEIVDDYTVIWHLDKVSPLLHFEISSLVEPISVVIPKHFIEANNIDINTSPTIMDKTPLGSGPWKVVEHTPTQKYEWERSPEAHPYRTNPAFERVIMFEVPEMGTRLAMGRTGEADVFVTTPDAAPEVQPAGLQIVFVPETSQAVIPFFSLWDPRVEPNHPLQEAPRISPLAIELRSAAFRPQAVNGPAEKASPRPSHQICKVPSVEAPAMNLRPPW